MADTTLDQDMILRAVRAWPRAEQEQLARAILIGAGQDTTIDPTTGRPYISSQELLGLFATPGKPAPTDEDIGRLRLEK